jgi:hypothetical protein
MLLSMPATQTSSSRKVGSSVPAFEKHFTPAELGRVWHVSSNTVRRWCEEFGGVLVIDRPEERFKRAYKSVRIPESTAAKIYASHFERAA